jgi:UDP:flavonoid glycosyltransferase YjiC (YdhE family)
MHPEQQANLDACVRKGFAIRLSKKRASASDILAAIDKLLGDKAAKTAVETFRKQLSEWDGPENAARFLKEHYG